MLKKPKKQRKARVDVGGSRPHRQAGGWVNGYWRVSSSGAWRNDPHHRNPRRSRDEKQQPLVIKVHGKNTIYKIGGQPVPKGTRKEEREKKRQIKRLQSLREKEQKLKNKQAKNYAKQMDIRAAMQNIPRSK
jgi:hypothetical protein